MKRGFNTDQVNHNAWRSTLVFSRRKLAELRQLRSGPTAIGRRLVRILIGRCAVIDSLVPLRLRFCHRQQCIYVEEFIVVRL